MMEQQKAKLNKIRAIFMDVDGVLTDGKIIIGNNVELKSFHARDGVAIGLAKRCFLKIGFITSRSSEAITRRAKELDIDYLSQGEKNKLSRIHEICSHEKISMDEICYIGDDIIDIPVLKQAGFSATVFDAPEEVKDCVDYISSIEGGCGAVRDIIRHILTTQKKWASAIDEFVLELEVDQK